MDSDLDELLKFLDTAGVQTSNGSYVSSDNIRRWVADRQRVALENEMRPQPKTMVQAKRMAQRDEELFPQEQSTDPFQSVRVTPSVPATEPQTTQP